MYLVTRRFPKEEMYCLANQIRRSAISIPSNIAEGRARHSTRDYMRFVMIARGSTAELETQLLIAQSLNYIGSEELNFLINDLNQIGRMLSGIFAKLDAKSIP
ncbi:MAG: four helix bundle protein [Bdellovibrionales bacterium]